MLYGATYPKQSTILTSAKKRMLLFLICGLLFIPEGVKASNSKLAPDQKISIEKIVDVNTGIYGYRLEYAVPVPLKNYWRFKTDFDSDILSSNSSISEHRFIGSSGNRFITENRFSAAPGLRFLWQTTIDDGTFQLNFKLLNAKEVRQQFHYGSIKLSPAGDYTIVTQTAFFDFDGVMFWVNYPWYGGMKSTLTKVAKWEQITAPKHMRLYQFLPSN